MRFRQNKTKQSRTNRERKKDLMIVMIVAHYNHNRNNKNNSNNNSNQSFSYEDHCQFHIQKVCYLYSPIFFLLVIIIVMSLFHMKIIASFIYKKSVIYTHLFFSYIYILLFCWKIKVSTTN